MNLKYISKLIINNKTSIEHSGLDFLKIKSEEENKD